MLLDLLVYPEGPRLRDHISHGEVDLRDLPPSLAAALLTLSLALASKYTEFALHNDLLLIHTMTSSYQPIFHPVALLRNQVSQYITLTVQKLPVVRNKKISAAY